MTKYVQDPPNTVKVELTEGCNLACAFCGINSIRSAPGKYYNFLSVALADKLARSLQRTGWRARMEFAMHGEPSMNPEFVRIIGVFRQHLPRTQLMMTSNGAGFLRDPAAVDAVFAAGLNLLCLDDYKNVRIVPKVLARYKGAVPVINYPESRDFSPYRRYPLRTRRIVVFQDISEPQDGVHNRLDNMGGLAAPKVDTMQGKRCARPFRELAIRWDGKIGACCDDWRGQYLIGDASKEDLGRIWQNERFMALRRKLYYGERDFGACDGCSDLSYRVGLLPDKLGKQHLPRPTARDRQVIAEGLRHAPLTTVVRRPWEHGSTRRVIPLKEVK